MFFQRDVRADTSNVLGTYIIRFHIVLSCICDLKLAVLIPVALGAVILL